MNLPSDVISLAAQLLDDGTWAFWVAYLLHARPLWCFASQNISRKYFMHI